MNLPLTSGFLFPSSSFPEAPPPRDTQVGVHTGDVRRRLHGALQLSQGPSLRPINVTLFGKRILADVIKVEDLEMGDYPGYMGEF